MISWLFGKIIHRNEEFIIINTNGVGYKVYISPKTFSKIKDEKEIEIYTYLNVKEDALDLYGFLTHEELQFFQAMISISGIGPKMAMNILGNASVLEIKKAVVRNDVLFFDSIPGIGKKKAERFIIEIRDKIEKGLLEEKVNFKENSEVIEALTKLGYRREEIIEIVRQIPDNISGAEKKITWILKNLGKNIIKK